MRGRHWDAISKAVGARIWPGEELQLTRVIKAGVLNHMEALQVGREMKWVAAMQHKQSLVGSCI
jgi:hypothetical protein